MARFARWLQPEASHWCERLPAAQLRGVSTKLLPQTVSSLSLSWCFYRGAYPAVSPFCPKRGADWPWNPTYGSGRGLLRKLEPVARPPFSCLSRAPQEVTPVSMSTPHHAILTSQERVFSYRNAGVGGEAETDESDFRLQREIGPKTTKTKKPQRKSGGPAPSIPCPGGELKFSLLSVFISLCDITRQDPCHYPDYPDESVRSLPSHSAPC